MRFDGKFARYEMSLKEKAVQHIVLDMEKSSSARASEAEVDCTADSSDRSGALGVKRRQARVKHKAVLGDAMLPAELGDAVPCRDKLDQTGRFQIHFRRGQRRGELVLGFKRLPIAISTKNYNRFTYLVVPLHSRFRLH